MQAIVLHSIVPVRTEPREGAEQETQLLFGELCEILDEQPRWLKVRNLTDGEEGFVDRKMITLMSPDEAETYRKAYTEATARVCLPMTYAMSENNSQTLPLTMGTLLPGYTNGRFELLGVTFRIDPSAVAPQPLTLTLDSLMQVTRFMLNAPYLWGGKNALGIDCSGFTQIVMSLFGISLPRNAGAQAGCGREVDDLSKVQAGDLLFFDHNDPESEGSEPNNCKGDTRITHVGLAMDQERVLHCSGRVKVERIDQRGIFGAEQQLYTHHLAAIRGVSI